MHRGLSITLIILIAAAILAVPGQCETGKWIRISLIEASKAEQFSVQKKIQQLEDQLKKVITDKTDKERYKVLKDFKQFKPLCITKPQKINFGQKTHISLDKQKKMFVEMTLNKLKKDYYPASVRWFNKVEKKEKDIIKANRYKFHQDRCLFFFSINPSSASIKLIAIEFVDPKDIKK
jgi:ABC-type phosphate transport system auxiliary subunit